MSNSASTEYGSGILDRLPTGACVLQKDFTVLFWNTRLEEWTGVYRDDILGQNILDRFPRLREPRFYNRLTDVLEGGPPAIFSSKLHKYFIPSILPGGQMRCQQTTVSPLNISDTGAVHALIVIEDVTDLTKTIDDYRALHDSALDEVKTRKKAEKKLTESQEQIRKSLKEKEILLKEIHHRVKNNMFTISALLSLQANEENDDRIFKMVAECQSRLQTMAMIHEALYRSESMAEIDLGTYLADLCEKIQSALIAERRKIQLKTESEKITLSTDQAIPCALAVNELVSNSIEHAFTDGRPGEILVKTRLLEEEEVLLTVSDNGPGLVNDESQREKSSSLGLELVKALVVDQLNGTLEMSSDNGTRFSIKFRVCR